MKTKKTLLLAIMALATLGAKAQVITTRGIDQITLGSSKEQVEKTLGRKILTETIEYGMSYQYIEYNGSKVYLSFGYDEGNDLVDIYTSAKSFATREGAKVGSTLADLKRIYGNKISTKEGDVGELYAIYGSKGTGQVLFQLGNRKVVDQIIIVKDSDEYFGF